MPRQLHLAVCAALLANLLSAITALGDEAAVARIRFATFNISLNRPTAGGLIDDLESRDIPQAKKIAAIIQRGRPDVLLLNEFDDDERGLAAERFQKNYLDNAQGMQARIRYEYSFIAAVNTGVPSGHDLNNDGPGDAFGFGAFPGQFGMLVLSRFPIDKERVRTFQACLWRDMPNALLPQTPDGPYYDETETAILRLSSKSHWDLPIQIAGRTIHFLCAHPTPPVFDGAEDRNGRRNH